MAVVLEVWGPAGPRAVRIEASPASVGKADGNDVVIAGDGAVSRTHLTLEEVGGSWVATDLGSRNGTWINGERIHAARVVRAGDEVRVGATRLVVRLTGPHREATATAALVLAPPTTPRERELLVALCKPVLAGSLVVEPPTVAALAAELFVSESAIKKMLGRLYAKFDLVDDDRRRGRLAAEAISRGAVSRSDLV